MPAVNRARLLALSDKEFSRESAAPVRRPAKAKFRALRLNLNKFDAAWDRKRGSAARMMAVLLREGDTELAGRVCASTEAGRTYDGAAAWLAGEARYLRKVANMMEIAAGRLGVVLQRCGRETSQAGST